MKIQCNVCEAAEAKVLCCADEAALCRECDEKVHAANKLASKHQRVPLSISPSHMPKCDICQVFFFPFMYIYFCFCFWFDGVVYKGDFRFSFPILWIQLAVLNPWEREFWVLTVLEILLRLL